MSKLEIQAIKKLPKKYVTDKTRIIRTSSPSGECVVAMHSLLLPIVFFESEMKWKKLEGVIWTDKSERIAG